MRMRCRPTWAGSSGACPRPRAGEGGKGRGQRSRVRPTAGVASGGPREVGRPSLGAWGVAGISAWRVPLGLLVWRLPLARGSAGETPCLRARAEARGSRPGAAARGRSRQAASPHAPTQRRCCWLRCAKQRAGGRRGWGRLGGMQVGARRGWVRVDGPPTGALRGAGALWVSRSQGPLADTRMIVSWRAARWQRPWQSRREQRGRRRAALPQRAAPLRRAASARGGGGPGGWGVAARARRACRVRACGPVGRRVHTARGEGGPRGRWGRPAAMLLTGAMLEQVARAEQS